MSMFSDGLNTHDLTPLVDGLHQGMVDVVLHPVADDAAIDL
jgi:hypothetical protein